MTTHLGVQSMQRRRTRGCARIGHVPSTQIRSLRTPETPKEVPRRLLHGTLTSIRSLRTPERPKAIPRAATAGPMHSLVSGSPGWRETPTRPSARLAGLHTAAGGAGTIWLRGRPWHCQGLQSLEVCISLPPRGRRAPVQAATKTGNQRCYSTYASVEQPICPTGCTGYAGTATVLCSHWSRNHRRWRHEWLAMC